MAATMRHCKITYIIILVISINMMNCVVILLKHVPVNFNFF